MSKKFKLNKNTTTVIALILVAIISIGISFVASKPDIYKPVYEVLDEKRADALALSAAAVTVSTGLAAFPTDATTPIANKISDITSYVLLIVCIIFLEKFLLTSMGFLSFAIIIPIACFLWIFCILIKKEFLKALAVKLIAFGLVLFLLVPTSVLFTTLIERSRFFDEAQSTINTALEPEEDLSVLDKIKVFTKEVGEKAKIKVNQFIDAVAIMIITTCAIPLGTLALMLWIVKMLFGINIKMPKPPKVNLKLKRLEKEEDDIDVLQIPEATSKE